MENSVGIFLLCIIPLAIHCAPAYYWRDWNGTVPLDAFVAGTDSRGTLYLAQAYVYHSGLFVGHVLSGETSIAVNPSGGAGPVAYSNILKVFCIGKEKVYWVPSNKTTIRNLLKTRNPVVGGIARNNATVYVGKYNTGSYFYIGSVHTDYYEYYTNASGDGLYTQSYEILIHQ